MPTVYNKCPDEPHIGGSMPVKQMAQSIMMEFSDRYEELIECHPKIDFLFAYNEDGIPMRRAGLIVHGLCRKTSLKERAAGRGDIEIMLDKNWWDDKETTEEHRRALLDHELWHIHPSRERDDLSRPKFYLRKHDVEVGWFSIIANDHGKNSCEVRQFQRLIGETDGTGGPIQRLLPFIEIPHVQKRLV